MTPSLPADPSLRFLKEQAKDLLKAHRAGDASCCVVLRKLNRFADATDADILAADIPLKEVQFALAMDHGFKSWGELKAHVVSLEAGGTNGEAGRIASGHALPGVPPLGWRRGRQCTFIGAMESVLRYHGESFDYIDLMGMSGAAFRIRLAWSSSDEITGGRIHPGVSHDPAIGPHADALMAATGYRYEIDGHFFHEIGGHEIVAARIQSEIDEGRPVLAMNLRDASCWGVIAGYDPDTPPEGPGRFLCRTYDDSTDPSYQRPSSFPWDVWLIRRAAEPAVIDELLDASVRGAVALLATERATVNRRGGWMWHYRGEYVNGLRAYDAWIADLADEEGLEALSPEQFLMYWQGNAVMYDQLHDARRAATAYLARAAEAHRGRRAELLRRASRAFEQSVRHMTEKWACCPFRKDGYVEPKIGWRVGTQKETFLGMSVPAYANEWTTDMRARCIEVLRTVKRQDGEALAVLTQWA